MMSPPPHSTWLMSFAGGDTTDNKEREKQSVSYPIWSASGCRWGWRLSSPPSLLKSGLLQATPWSGYPCFRHFARAGCCQMRAHFNNESGSFWHYPRRGSIGALLAAIQWGMGSHPRALIGRGLSTFWFRWGGREGQPSLMAALLLWQGGGCLKNFRTLKLNNHTPKKRCHSRCDHHQLDVWKTDEMEGLLGLES